MSWILEVKRLLGEPPPHGPGGNGDDAAEHWVSVVALSVQSGALWTVLVDAPDEDPWQCRLTFPGAAVAAGENPWAAVATVAREELAAESDAMLALGALDALTLPGGGVVVPYVIALPSPDAPQRADQPPAGPPPGIVRLPLQAIGTPRLVEERGFEVGGRVYLGRVLHVGRHRLQGPIVEILDNLLLRLFPSLAGAIA